MKNLTDDQKREFFEVYPEFLSITSEKAFRSFKKQLVTF